MGAVLCMNLLAVSGCDRAVQSAVVEEKDETDQKKEENKKTVQETVAEQVEAPETYRAIIQADLRSADREDKENPMKFTLTADAPVKVPDVDAICLKKVKRVAISEEEQNKIKETFDKGQPILRDRDIDVCRIILVYDKFCRLGWSFFADIDPLRKKPDICWICRRI